MMAIAIAVIVIAFWFSQNPLIFWGILGTGVLILTALSIFVAKYDTAHGNTVGQYVSRPRRNNSKVIFQLVGSMGKSRKRKSRRGGVRSSLIGLHRR